MNIEQIQLLKDILAVPTKTHQEERLVKFLIDYFECPCRKVMKGGVNCADGECNCEEMDRLNDFEILTDDIGNLMVVKQHPHNFDGVFPCVVAHTDTVHSIDSDYIDIKTVQRPNTCGDMRTALTGFHPETGEPSGCGGDDKAGVFACLMLFEEFNNIKLFFPVAEETGCHGSKAANSEWFSDVGYFIQFDSPNNNTMSKTLLGRPLYDDQSLFCQLSMGLIQEHGITEYQHHPYTDVATLGERFGVQCLNVAAGYYKMHRAEEYVVIEDVVNAIALGIRLIDRLGEKRYAKRLEKRDPVRILTP